MREVKNKRFFIFILVAALVCVVSPFSTGCADPPYGTPKAGTAVRYDFISTADGQNLPCSIYLPSGYDPNQSYPLWIDLHALGGYPFICNNPFNAFSNTQKDIANKNKWIIIEPWGRHLSGYYIDGVAKNSGANKIPKIIDGFSSLAGWRVVNGSWSVVNGGVCRQEDATPGWKEMVCGNSWTTNGDIRLYFREVSRTAPESAVGVNFRRADDSNFYHIGLSNEDASSGRKRYARVYRVSDGEWTLLQKSELNVGSLAADNPWTSMKISLRGDNAMLFVNDYIVNIQIPKYDTAYGSGRILPDPPLSGEVSICSYGGVHEFDEFRLTNDLEYGERDILDCINQAAEMFSVDENRIYLSGFSMGGIGAYVLGIHNPGLFAAVAPESGASDLVHDYAYMKEHYPYKPGAPYADINDGRMCESWRMLAGKEDQPDLPTLDTPLMRDNSARYVLENLANLPMRIVHGATDSIFPNDYKNLVVLWWKWKEDNSGFTQVQAPAPYSPATSTYANGKDLYNLLKSWSALGPYYGEYSTNAYAGHGFVESYYTTAAFFRKFTRTRFPLEVAYKTYDDAESSSYWMRFRRDPAASTEAGVARAKVIDAENKVVLGVRNLEEITLDLMQAGVEINAGTTVTLGLSDQTEPHVMAVTDKRGKTTLRLVHAWPAGSFFTVKLDGNAVSYQRDGAALIFADLDTTSAHTLTIEMSPGAPTGLLANAGFEEGEAGTYPTGWLPGNGGALYGAYDQASHTGNRSARIKSGGNGGSWESDAVNITPGKVYNLYAFTRARLLKGASLGMSIKWLDASGEVVAEEYMAPKEIKGDFTRLEWDPLCMEVTAPGDAVSAKVNLRLENTSGSKLAGSAWFDDVVLLPQ